MTYPLLGAHLSTAGSLLTALDQAASVEAECLQIFTRPPGRWEARAFRAGEDVAFCARRAEMGALPLLVHDIYLTNLAAPEEERRARSIATLAEERRRCAALGADGLVCHMGSHGGEGVTTGLQRFAAGLAEVVARTEGVTTRLLLENAAGQGSALGDRFAHLGEVLARVNAPASLGVCLDTCHTFAAGYDLITDAGYAATWEEFHREVGFEWLRALHLNDSKKGLGCRVDRHEHIGRGALGEAVFARLLGDSRLAGLPMVIETPERETMHRVNLDRLRALRDPRVPPPLPVADPSE